MNFISFSNLQNWEYCTLTFHFSLNPCDEFVPFLTSLPWLLTDSSLSSRSGTDSSLSSWLGKGFFALVADGLLFVLEVGDGLLLVLVVGEGLLLPLVVVGLLLRLFVSFPRLTLLFLTIGDLLRDFFLASLFLLTVVTTEALLAQACRSAGTGPSRSDTGSLFLPPFRVSSLTAPSLSFTPFDSGLGLPPDPLVDGPSRSRIDFFTTGLGDLFAFLTGLLASLRLLFSSLSPLRPFLSALLLSLLPSLLPLFSSVGDLFPPLLRLSSLRSLLLCLS